MQKSISYRGALLWKEIEQSLKTLPLPHYVNIIKILLNYE